MTDRGREGGRKKGGTERGAQEEGRREEESPRFERRGGGLLLQDREWNPNELGTP